MVNKAALAVVAVVVIGVVGVGMLVGTLLDAGDGPAGTDNDDGGGEGPAGNGTATQTAANATTPDESDQERTPILPRRFESAAIAENVTRLINEERENQSLDSLQTTGETATRLTEMAEGHSLDMADAGYDGHNVSGTDTGQRYRDNNLFERCKYSDPANVYDPEDHPDRFEVVAIGEIGQYHRVDGNETFIENESHAASVVVDDWLEDDEDARDAVLVEAFTRAGVGVEITRNNAVFVTVNLCE